MLYFSRHRRLRALFIGSIVVIAFGITSWFAHSQRAANQSREQSGKASPALVAEKGITPAANTIVVNSLSDAGNAGDGLCTLREAIAAANNNTASGAAAGECAAGSNNNTDTINISVSGTIDLATALPNISSDMIINGPGASSLTVRRGTAAGTPNFRIFTTSDRASISGMTITNGRTADGVVPPGSFGSPGDHGGGIFNSGVLTLTNMTITGNRTGNGSQPGTSSSGSSFGGPGGFGGGIYSTNNLFMSNVTVSNNTTGDGASSLSGGGGGRGGGVFISSGGLTMISCSVSGNATGLGAVSTNGGGSSTGGDGGGINIQVGSNIVIAFTSIVNNTTGSGQGISSSISWGSGAGGGISIASGTGIDSGNIIITNCTISGNHTGDANGFSGQAGRGGGLTNASSNNLSIINTTISGNQTGSGFNGAESGIGAGMSNTATTKLINSTISGNIIGPTGSASGAGIWNAKNLFLTNSTVVLNTNGTFGGAGIHQFNNSSSISMRNTIVALNTNRGETNSSDLSGPPTFNSQGHNLIGNADSASGFSAGIGDQIGTTASPINPQLAALANNGGATATHRLLPNSPALDAGDDCVTQAAHCGDPNISQLTSDGRGSGFVRLADGPDADTTATADIGAYETQPGLASLQDATFGEDRGLSATFDVGDPSTVNSITATSSNPVPVPNDSAHLSAALLGTTGVVSIVSAADLSGTTSITITINRTTGPESKTFSLTVTPVNDPPSFTLGPNLTVNEDAGAQTVSNWATGVSAGPPDESGQALTFQVVTSGSSLFSVAPALSSTGTLTYTPAPNANGSATITAFLKDNGGIDNGGTDTSGSQTFTITVNPVNDAPSFTKGANQTVNEDSGSQTVSNWAQNISAGPTDEVSTQTLSFQVTNNTNPGLFAVAPAFTNTGTLLFTPAANANGSATITVVLKDSGGTANGGVDTSSPPQTFTITVNPVNDAPSFTKGANQTVLNNVGPQTINSWATAISPGPSDEASQTVTFQVTGNTNSALFSAAPAISSTGSLTYTPSPSAGGTATISINLKDNGGTANGGVDTSFTQSFTITVTAAGGTIAFPNGFAFTTENSGSTTVNVVRSGDTSKAVTVDYATSADTGVPCATANGLASPKCDFTAALGTLNFAAGETSKPITILISQDSFVEGPETFRLTLSNPTNNAALGISILPITINDDGTEPPTNIIDDPNMFVRMHYHDFLNREADQSGLTFWTGQMTNCGNSDLTVCRVNVSGAFFLSIEFQQTGYLVERMYKTAYGDVAGMSQLGGPHQISVPVVRANEFLADTQRVGRGVVVNTPGWETVLENNKQAYALEFVQTSRFISAFPAMMTPAQFVDKLNQNAGNVLSDAERTTAINLFGNAADTANTNARARALRQVAEDADLQSAEFNRAFVLTQFIGYLRRNPNDAPDADYSGYDFWLAKLVQFNGDYVKAEMVKAFIASPEYRQRFGP